MPAERQLGGPKRAAVLAGALLCCAPLHAAAAPVVDLQAPQRTFGYFIGDTMDATAIITAAPGSVLEPTSLPAEGPISTWIDLRRITASEQQTADTMHVILHLQYQTFFDPEEASRGNVPGFDVTLLSHGQHLAVHIPGFGFMASPFRHVLQPVIESSALQPDHEFLKVPTSILRGRTWVASAIAAVLAAALVARLGLLPAWGGRGRPFTAASGRIARLARRTDKTDAARDAMLELHRAFDATAGSRMLAPDIGLFMEKHRRFAPLKPDIETFFSTSRNFFFGPTQQDPEPALRSLAILGRRLSRAERAS